MSIALQVRVSNLEAEVRLLKEKLEQLEVRKMELPERFQHIPPVEDPKKKTLTLKK